MKILFNIIKGMVLGIANVIPGVSGGTMAVVLGIYDKIISSVNNLLKDFKNSVKFLAQIGIGVGLGVLLFSNIISFLLTNYPQQTNFLFIGLILGTCPLLYKKATEEKVKPINYLWFIIAFGILVLMSVFKDVGRDSSTIIRHVSIASVFPLILAGFVAAMAMVLPGISGSFVLLLLGLYNSLVIAVKEFNIVLLSVVTLGVILGFITMTKTVEALFKKYPQAAYWTILGLVLGSLFAIYPGFSFNLNGFTSILTLLIGFVIAYLIGKQE
ncbi:putative membrane protein [Hathewaya proteolytica DSM 3090]|uniref:Putative membrane protein n=1 Tax=Hathewaya proteolytica DSM 3090 TaxID=1121331 RepID=A0A1M6QFM6_9CLOT|nr:DUF368 domain-containing protein [Hathewaya proteolytica]SHK18975.1 putative membrane protein [Hathewaya proteolytica DSM 3090]